MPQRASKSFGSARRTSPVVVFTSAIYNTRLHFSGDKANLSSALVENTCAGIVVHSGFWLGCGAQVKDKTLLNIDLDTVTATGAARRALKSSPQPRAVAGEPAFASLRCLLKNFPSL